MDWAATPLGSIEAWPPCRRNATALLLRSPVPIVMLWGEKLSVNRVVYPDIEDGRMAVPAEYCRGVAPNVLGRGTSVMLKLPVIAGAGEAPGRSATVRSTARGQSWTLRCS